MKGMTPHNPPQGEIESFQAAVAAYRINRILGA
jgi:hypothetical protein